MFKFITIFFFLFASVASFAQTDTILKKAQKGYLFISQYNGEYDWDGSRHWRPVGFHDYFFPSSQTDILQFLDSNKSLTLLKGLRIDFFPERYYYKKNAKRLLVTDKNYSCYSYDTLYILPVVLEFKEYKDIWPSPCKTNTFEIETKNGSHLKFERSLNAVFIRRAQELPKQKE